jgi:hypothetical protein
MADEKYEIRLVKIEGTSESIVDAQEVPMEKLQVQQSQQATELPNREAMSLVNANVAAPINLALALNALSDNSVAIASAQQYAPINQGI